MNIDEIIALRKAFTSVKERQQKNIPPELNEKIAKLKAVIALSVGNSELVAQARN
jgi:hypothetical protein